MRVHSHVKGLDRSARGEGERDLDPCVRNMSPGEGHLESRRPICKFIAHVERNGAVPLTYFKLWPSGGKLGLDGDRTAWDVRAHSAEGVNRFQKSRHAPCLIFRASRSAQVV